MAFQSIEMRELTKKLDSQTEKYLEAAGVYETKKSELMDDLKSDNIDRLQEYDFMVFKCALEDKTKVYHDIQVTREEIKLRELYEKSKALPNPSKEYFEVSIAYWEQKLEVIRLKKGEYSYNSYKHVANDRIWRAKEKLARCTA